MKKLREALKPHVPVSPDAEITHDSIQNIDLLNGVISEALRLFPPNPSHPTRVTPPEGAVIGGRFIAGGTQVMAPQYVIGRGKSLLGYILITSPADTISKTKASTPERANSSLKGGTALQIWLRTRR